MVGEVLGRLTGGAAVNVILDKASHSCPPKRSREEFVSFEMTRVARTGCVVMEGNDIVMEFWVMRDIQLSFVEDGAIGDCPVFGESLFEF